MSWTFVISDLHREEIGTFYGKKLWKTNQKEFRVEKAIMRKDNKLYVKWKWYNNLFNSWIDEKKIVWMSDYFPKPKSLKANVKVELDLPNYATKADLKNATGVDTTNSTKKNYLTNLNTDVDKLDIDKLKNVPTNLSNLKSKVDELDVDKLIAVPVDLSKLQDVVKMILLKKIYIMLR